MGTVKRDRRPGSDVAVSLYAEMTWPQVADLPRATPMLIPIGSEYYDLQWAARRLKAEQIVVLPAIPYGFRRGDGHYLGTLAVGQGLFRRVMLGVQRELHAQGFKRTLFLDGHGISTESTAGGLTFLRVPCERRPASGWPKDLPGRVVVINTGHTEQHGHHLPTGTDTLIVQAIADGLEAAASGVVVCLPAWPYGVSTHTREFPSTLNLGGRVFEDFFLEILGRLVGLGAEMIFFSNAHGGNHSFLTNVVKYAGERWPWVFTATEWLHTTGPALERYRQGARGSMGHGGELETSYILHLRPELVDMTKATIETDFVTTAEYYMDWIEGGRLIANPPWGDDTQSGIYGDATLGIAEKGRLWLEAAIEEKLSILAELREQHERRKVRRPGT